jgi:hypothetical protein
MLERRILNYRLVLTCESGLVELDVSGLPEVAIETAHVQVESGLGIVGRIDGEAFAVTRGRVEPWGLADVTPAMLVGSPNQSILDLPAALAGISAHVPPLPPVEWPLYSPSASASRVEPATSNTNG